MKLTEIIKGFNKVKIYPKDVDVEISGMSHDSRKIKQGDLYFCLRGENSDGHNFASIAENNGAVAVVTEKLLPKINCVQVLCEDARLAYSYFSAAFYGNPQKDLKIIGVVGTNGKTSTVKIIGDILSAHGKTVATVGTNGVKWQGGTLPPTLTTPDPNEFYCLLSRFKSSGVKYVVTELSAHAIWLKKLASINFECLVFTNCTHDHLDYFTDFESYRKVKKSAFSKNARFFVVNADDPLGREIYRENPKKTVTYGIYSPSDVFAINLKESLNGLSFIINMFDMIYKVNSKLYGEFNAYNLLGSACACFLLGIKPEKIVKYIGDVTSAEGRMQCVEDFNGAKIFVDYAHTPDGLNKSLSFIASVTEGQTFLVFGCGGDRDRQKRPLMGKIAGDIIDNVIITSDNPRFEDENEIIEEIEEGLKTVSSNYVKIADRYLAVKYAVERLKSGDTLIIAGKGAEKYIEKQGEKIEYSDESAVKRIVAELTAFNLQNNNTPKITI